MISAVFAAVGLAAQIAVGCAQVAFAVTKVAAKVGARTAKIGWKVGKGGYKLGKGVIKTVNKCRIMARDNIPSPANIKSHLFTKDKPVPKSFSEKLNKPSKPKKKLVTQSNLFTKKKK